jgi:hypothetical protein
MSVHFTVPTAEAPRFYNGQAEDPMPWSVMWQDSSFDFNQAVPPVHDMNDTIHFQESPPSKIVELDIADEVPGADPAESSIRFPCQHRNRPRAKVIPEHIWTKHKRAIEHLYIERDLKLAQVREEMIASYGFDAS